MPVRSLGKQARRSTRLRGFDYRTPGAYFVTICSFGKQCAFGDITDDVMTPSAIGRIIEDEWNAIAHARDNVLLDTFQLMPNHAHGVLWLFAGKRPESLRYVEPEEFLIGGSPTGRLRDPEFRLEAGTLGAVVGQFKSNVTKRVAAMMGRRIDVWQRGFEDEVVRDGAHLENVRKYIRENPLLWHLDLENPRNWR